MIIILLLLFIINMATMIAGSKPFCSNQPGGRIVSLSYGRIITGRNIGPPGRAKRMILVGVLWMIMAAIIFIQYAPVCKGLSVGSWIAVALVFIIGAPFFMIVEVLEAILNCFFTGGMG